ncbi:MAG TPA: SRPBCC domain-containing protein [Chloroflexia bacterium]|nr:SRPBCC domain-containing protein [Chloroflexia bacterium]
MLTQERAITARRMVEASSTELFRAFTNTGALRDWLSNGAQVEVRKGGRISLWWNDGYYTSGTFSEVKPGESLTFTWQGPGEPASEVRVSLTSRDGGTDVEVTHDGVGSSELAEKMGRLWEEGLENLQSMVETGDDLRFTRRPMFGLNAADEMTPEIAEKIGVPVTEGLRLGGLVPGMGAEAAGFQKDDVIVAMGDRDVMNFQTFVAAIEPHRAGDRVPVTFYRGHEKRTVEMELSARPMPEVPATVEAMVEGARQMYATLDKELDELLEGVADEDAERSPSSGEWSAKMVLAHLIGSERDTQVWMAAMTEDFDLEQPFHSNSTERLQAMVSVYSPLPVLVEELKRSEAVTVALASSLSDVTAGHKHWFKPLATWLTTLQDHHREHFGEIKKLINGGQ